MYKLLKITFIFYIAVLALPAWVTSFTDPMPWLGALSNFILPTAFYAYLMSLSPRLGRSIWFMFPFAFLAAFNMVLLWLYGCGVIAVDMWLNLLTTNPSEVSELLSQLMPAIYFVIVAYLPPLILGVVFWCKKLWLPSSFLLPVRHFSLPLMLLGFLLMGTATLTTSFNPVSSIFPANVIENFVLAVRRYTQSHDYHKTSSSFTFNATSTHPDSVKEVYVLVIGETSRASSWKLSGYGRATNPLLSRNSQVIYFDDALSQSNTTHKSVPMLLSQLDAYSFGEIGSVKSILQAAREAGFHTSFFSNQRPNGSFIDFFGDQADTVVFLKTRPGAAPNPSDFDLLPLVRQIITHGKLKEFIVLHTYGSHFSYCERYPRECRHFVPDTYPEASITHRDNLVNAYDNTIVATDSLLSALSISLSNNVAAMIYTSDHGEDVFDEPQELFLHASPRPTLQQLRVPMLVYTSPAYDAAFPSISNHLRANSRRPVQTSRSYFHTALSLAGINTPVFEEQASLASPLYKPIKPVFLDDHNHAVNLQSILR